MTRHWEQQKRKVTSISTNKTHTIPAYTVEEVRKAAAGTSFHLISHNKSSKLLSFRSGTTRINVYYITAVVGTCLDHPTKGKTQLFRRNIDLNFLALLFRDPRIHYSKGYYTRNSIHQNWEILNSHGNTIALSDSAVRWMYVASATGLSNVATDLWKIAVFCTTWDCLYWPTGVAPKLSQTRLSCGSTKAFANMLLEAAMEVVGKPVRGVYFGKNGQGRSANCNGGMEDVESGSCCAKVEQFLEAHTRGVDKLKRQLLDLKRDIQIELMRWFFARSHCGYYLVVDETTLVTTRYSSLVDCTHVDYANLAYTKEVKAQMCRLHGVLWEPGPS